MRTNSLFLFPLVLLLVLSGCDRTPAIRPLTGDTTIVAFGDSITHGNGAMPEQSYPAVLTRLLGVEVINAGVPGETTDEGLQRLSGMLAKYQPQLVILCEGGNDFLRRQDGATTKANLGEMVRTILASGADLILIGVPRPGLFLKADPVYAELAGEYKVIVMEDALPDILAERSLKSDLIHPNAAGYRRLAGAVAATLQQHTNDK